MVSVPMDLGSCITDLTYKLKGEECDITGRDTECSLVWQTLKKYNKKSAILVGEPGVGKTAIMEKIAFDIINGNCPEQFKYFNVLALSVTAMIAGTKYRGMAEEKFNALVEFLKRNEDVILYIDEIHLIMGAGAAEGAIDMANSLKPILASGGNIRIVGATTSKEYEELIAKDRAIKRRFRTIEVKEPKKEEVYSMLKKSIETLSRYHGVSISKAMVDFIVWNSDSFNCETKNPDKTKDIIDLAMVVAKEKRKRSVDEDSVIEILKNNPMLRMPAKLTSCLTNVNDELNGKRCDILGRDRECVIIWQTMQKKDKRNTILIGEPGVGKTAIMEKITFDIIEGKCPSEFSNHKVLSLDVTEMIAGTRYRGDAEEKFTALVEFLQNNQNVILYIDEIHLIMGAGAVQGGIDLANSLKPILAGGNIRIIAATTSEEYKKLIATDSAIKRRFRPIEVKEPKTKEVYPMLKKSIETLSQYHGVSISKKMVDFVILNAACFHNETHNPDRTKDLIDLSMVTAKQAGKTSVDRKSVLDNFDYHFETFAKMSDRVKRSTAYHEAGHCLVALCSKELNNYDVVAVSIMPSDSYLGVTVYEYNDFTPEPTMEYFIDSIARALAGRVAEKKFTKTITAGAQSDLRNATKTAYDIVTKYGMTDFGMNRGYTEETISEEAKNKINNEIDSLIKKAMERAEEILEANCESLNMLVEVLMNEGIVGENDLKKILNNIRKM